MSRFDEVFFAVLQLFLFEEFRFPVQEFSIPEQELVFYEVFRSYLQLSSEQ